jgi:tetratricopeptide (TPR) repeat protein
MTTVISVLLALSQAAVQPSPPRDVNRDVQQLQILAKRGDIRASREALERAVEGKPAAERTEIQIAVADVLARAGDPASIAEAERLYSISIDDARKTLEPTRRLRTENNYAALLLQQGRAGDARRQFEAMQEPMRKQSQSAQARYFYNYAKAAEETGDPALALKLYGESLSLEPGFDEAARSASTLAIKSPSESIGIPATVALVDRLLRAGQLELAAHHLVEALTVPRWVSHPQYPEIVASVARYLAVAKVDQVGFDRVWVKPLDAARRGTPRAQARYEDLRRVYSAGPIPLTLEGDEARFRFSPWLSSDAEAAAFVMALHEVGLQRRLAGQKREALSRLASGWALSRVSGPASGDAGMAAAVDLADLLLAEGPELDPGGRVIDAIISQLFEGKGRAYAGRDYANALRFHLLLGSIFERQKRWGPAGNPRSALFQWTMALKAHDALRATGRPGDLSEVPGLHLRLAQASAEVGDRPAALRELLTATDGFLALKQVQPAADALTQARSYASFGTPADRKRLSTLEANVAAQPR